MTIKEAQTQALQIADRYKAKNATDGHKQWDVSAYMAGFVGDVGDLSKLVMAKSNYREIEGTDKKLAHELSDCLWSILVLAHHLDIDLESEFTKTIAELSERLK